MQFSSFNVVDGPPESFVHTSAGGQNAGSGGHWPGMPTYVVAIMFRLGRLTWWITGVRYFWPNDVLSITGGQPPDLAVALCVGGGMTG